MNIAMRVWYWVVGEPTISKALTNVNKTIHKLEKAVDFQRLKKEAMAEAAKLAAEAEKLAHKEAEKAREVADNVKKLFGID